MTATDERTWELPRHPWILRMTWSKLLFAHWRVDPNVLSVLLPDGLELDTHQDRAWIGVVPFLMSGVAPRCFPSIPKLSRFLELNVRTYVTYEGKPGVWFFSLDAANRLAVRAARATFNLPYMDASMSLNTDAAQEIHYRSKRIHRSEPRAAMIGRGRRKTFDIVMIGVRQKANHGHRVIRLVLDIGQHKDAGFLTIRREKHCGRGHGVHRNQCQNKRGCEQ